MDVICGAVGAILELNVDRQDGQDVELTLAKVTNKHPETTDH